MEIDETYVGGKLKLKNKRGKGAYLKNKSTVFGMVERNGVLRGKVVPNEKRTTLFPIIEANVTPGTTISSDTAGAYERLGERGYDHGMVNHMIDEWVRGKHHTNTIEGFWSHLKRGIKSTHASVSRKHLQRYVDEFAFRFNNRDDPSQMFNRMLKQISKPISSS